MFKKGQVTIFVILGLIVFTLSFILFYFLRLSDGEVPIEEYDEMLVPLASNVRFCMEELSKEAFEEIGVRGGRLEASTVTYGLSPAYVNTGLELFSGSGLILPYWTYFDGDPSCIDCDLVVNIPPLTGSSGSIGFQVEKYIEDNILSCLNYFEDYTDFTVSEGIPKASVTFRSDDVLLFLEFPLSVLFFDDLEASVNTFSTSIDLRFRKMYEFATDLAYQLQFLDEDPFLDKAVITIIDVLSVGGREADIPPATIDYEMGSHSFRFWLKSETERIIKRNIQETIPHFQIVNSKDSFVPMSLNPYIQNIYSKFQFAMETSDYETLFGTTVRFLYFENWPFYLRISPGGELISPIRESSSISVPLFGDVGTTKYEYFYDMTFPVLITLEDSLSYEGDGYYFQFPMTVNIARNNPRRTDLESLPSISFDEDEFVESGFGALEQRTVPVNIRLRDGYFDVPVYDLSLKYSCGERSIYIEPLSPDAPDGIIRTFVPPCLRGTFSVDRGDYFSKPVIGDFLIGSEKQVTVKVFPSKEVSVSIGTLRFEPTALTLPSDWDEVNASIDHFQLRNLEDNRNWNFIGGDSGASYSPLDEEVVTVMFNRVTGFGEADFIRILSFEYPFNAQKVDIVPGDYEVTLFSSFDLEENLTIMNQTFNIKGESVFLDAIEFEDSFIVGFLELKGENVLSLSDGEIFVMNELNLVYPSFDINKLRFHQDLDVLEMVFNLSNENARFFGEFKR